MGSVCDNVGHGIILSTVMVLLYLAGSWWLWPVMVVSYLVALLTWQLPDIKAIRVRCQLEDEELRWKIEKLKAEVERLKEQNNI